MRIYGKPKINEKSTSFNREIFQNKKRFIKKESDEENIENNAQIKEEKITYNKLPKKNKVYKNKQLSVNKEYNRLSPQYYLEDPDKIQSIKHSSSTSKNFSYNFNKDESENNSKNIDENLLFSKPNNSKDNKINNYLSMNKNKDEDLYEIESQSESVYKGKNKKGIYKSKIKYKNVLNEKLRNIIKKLSSSKRKKQTYFHKWIKKTFTENEYEEIEVEEDEEISELEKVVEKAQDEEESTNGFLQSSHKKKANKNTINERNRSTKKLDPNKSKRYEFLRHIIVELDKHKNKSTFMSKWYSISKIKDKSKKAKKNLNQRNNLDKLDESEIYLNDQILAKTTYFNSFDSKEDDSDFRNLLANSTNITDSMLKETAKKEKKKKKHLKTNKNENKENIEIRAIKDEENEYDNKVFNINDKKSVEEKIDEINRNHKSNKFQRYLLFKLPKSKKKRRDNFKIDNKRESFSNLNLKIKAEHFDKTLLKILNKAYCRKNNLMKCFDKWFDVTYNNKNYIPFLREEKIIPIIDKVNDSISISKDSNGKSHKSKSKKTKKLKTEIKVNSDGIDSKRNSLSSITNNLNDLRYSKDNINIDNSINKSKLSDPKNIKKKNKIKDKKGDDKSKDKKLKKKDKDKEKEEINEIKNIPIGRKISEPKEEITKSLDIFSNIGIDKDSKSEIKFTGMDLVESDGNNMMKKSSNSIIKDKNGKKKKKYNHKRNKSNKSNNENLISEDNIESIEKIMNPNEESTYNDIENIINLDRSNDIDRSGIKNLKNNLKDKKQNDIDLKSDFLELEMTHSDDNIKNRKNKKFSNKGKSIKGIDEDDIDKSNDDIRSVDIDKKYSKEERRLIKKYKKALHKLRVVLRSHRKRRKEQNTFNPDLEIKKSFQNWVIKAFPEGLDQYRIKKEMESSSNFSKSRDKSKKYKKKNKSRDKSDSEANKLKKLKHTIKLVNKKRKKLKSKSFEDIIIFFNKWKEIIRETNKELNKEKTKEKIKYITKEIIKDISKDKIKSINDNKDNNKENKEELNQNNIKKTSYTYKKDDAIRPIKKNSRPVIDWNELSRDDSYSLYDESNCKDGNKMSLTKSQVIKIDNKPKRARTQSKNDIDENDEDFYFMKIIERKQNKGMKRKLFDKISSQIEQNIKENYIEEHKKENVDSFEIADDKDNIEKKNNVNGNNKLNDLISSEKNKRNKIVKESPNNISNNNDLISINSEILDSNKKSDNKNKNYLVFMSSSEKERNIETERSREKEKQREQELQREEELLRQKEREKELQRQKEEKEREKELQMQKEKERLEKENLEKEIQERERREKKEKEKENLNKRTNKNCYIINPNQNKYDTPKKLLPAYDPYESKPENANPPKVQPPRQVLELEKLKGKSQLPDILRTSSFNRKKFGFGNLDYVEPGELVSNIKLRQIKDMIVRQQSAINIFPKSTFRGQTEKKKSFDFIPSSYSSRKYESDNDFKKVISPQAKKKLEEILKKVNTKKLKSKVELFFKKWKNPSKYIKNMPNLKGIPMMDCAPPPKQEKKTSTIPVVFLSKSIIKDTKPFQFEEEKNSIDNYKIDNKYENNILNNSENTFERYRKDSKPQKVKNGGRIEFVFPSQKEISNKKEIESQQKSSNMKYAYNSEEQEEEEIEEEGEDEEIYDFRNYYNNEKKETRRAIRFVQKDYQQNYYNNYNSNKKRKDEKSSKERNIKNDFYNNNYRNDNIRNKMNKSEEKYKLLSPQIYNINKICNRTKNNILNLMENAPKYLFAELSPELFINFTKKYNKETTAYHIFCLYSLFNQNYEFYIIRKIFNKWKKKIKRRFKRSKISKTNFYNCDNYGHCRGCVCYKKRNKQSMMKNILFKFIFMKEYNPTKYYLNLWYKKTFL